MRRRDLFLLLASAVIAWPLIAAAANLDAPVVQKPTLRTEIQRGREAISGCSYGPGRDYLKFSDCIDGVVKNASQLANADDAFKLGVYSHAWETTDIVLHIYEKSGSNPEQVALMRKFGWFYYRWSNDLRSKLGLNNKQLCEVTKVHDCSWYEQMNQYWSALPHP